MQIVLYIGLKVVIAVVVYVASELSAACRSNDHSLHYVGFIIIG